MVFAGNDYRLDKESYYVSMAYDLGKILAQNDFTVVTGGGPGLMDAVSRGAYENDGKTIGICLNVAGRNHTKALSTKMTYDHLGPRQDKLISLGDAYLALPGGAGTLYEISAVIALKQKGELDPKKPLILISDFYKEFESAMRKMFQEGFVTRSLSELFYLENTPREAVDRLVSVI